MASALIIFKTKKDKEEGIIFNGTSSKYVFMHNGKKCVYYLTCAHNVCKAFSKNVKDRIYYLNPIVFGGLNG